MSLVTRVVVCVTSIRSRAYTDLEFGNFADRLCKSEGMGARMVPNQILGGGGRRGYRRELYICP